jgi:hypothetical protein
MQGDIKDAITQAAYAYELDPNLLMALVMQESRGNPGAVSPAGAQGLMQLMPATAKYLNVTDPLDPYQNVYGGAKYLREQLDRFGGDRNKALAAYNAGPTAVRRYNDVPPFRETRDYVGHIANTYDQIGKGLDLDTAFGSPYQPYASQPAKVSMGRAPQVPSDMYGQPSEFVQAAQAVTPSAATPESVDLTRRTAEKVISGLPAENWTGSLTHPTDRGNNSTGALAAEQIPAWQTALRIVNPVNFLQLPVRLLRMVDYTLREAAGSPTLTDDANAALDYVDAADNRAALGNDATTADILSSERTKTAGLRSQMGSLPERWVRALTQDPFDPDRQAIQAAQAVRARLRAVRDYATADAANTEATLASKLAPYRLQSAKTGAEAGTFHLQHEKTLAPWNEKLARTNALAAEDAYEAAPEQRALDAEAKRAQINNYNRQADQFGEDGLTYYQRWMRQRQIEQDRLAEESARLAQRREQRLVNSAEAETIALAMKAKSVEDANAILRKGGITDHEAVIDKGWIENGIKVVPIKREAGAAAEPPSPPVDPGLSGMSSHGEKPDYSSADNFAAWSKRNGIPKEKARAMWKEYKQSHPD